jgi:ribonuclease Z
MLTEVQAAGYAIRGVSVAGVYTSLHVRELDALFDCGWALRKFAGAPNIFLSHGHADHSGALVALLGMRGLMQIKPPRVFVPRAIEAALRTGLRAFSELQRYELGLELVAMDPGEELQLRPDLWVRAFRTHHPAPSLGYQFFSRVRKLKPEHQTLSGAELGALKARDPAAFAALFTEQERLDFAYATDTLVRVLDTHPSLLRTRVLVLECSFLDDRKSKHAVHSGGHIHLDELIERADSFQNEALVLMHFSQTLSPQAVRDVLDRRCPSELRQKLVIFAPATGNWPGV